MTKVLHQVLKFRNTEKKKKKKTQIKQNPKKSKTKYFSENPPVLSGSYPLACHYHLGADLFD